MVTMAFVCVAIYNKDVERNPWKPWIPCFFQGVAWWWCDSECLPQSWGGTTCGNRSFRMKSLTPIPWYTWTQKSNTVEQQNMGEFMQQMPWLLFHVVFRWCSGSKCEFFGSFEGQELDEWHEEEGAGAWQFFLNCKGVTLQSFFGKKIASNKHR